MQERWYQIMGFELIAPNLYFFKINFCGIYVAVYLKRGKKNVLIDSGMNAKDVDEIIVPALKKLKLDITDINILLNTHTHADHIGGHHRIKELNPNIKVITTKLSKEKVENPLKFNIEIRQVFPNDSPSPSYGLKGVLVDELINDGDVIEGLKIIFTPGHDNDAVCFLDLDTKTLLTGDSIQQNGTDTQGMALYMYLEPYIASLKKLKTLDIERIISGHPFNPWGGNISGKEKVREFLDFNLNLVGEYHSLVKENINKEMCDIVHLIIDNYNGIKPDYLFLGLYTVKEHINKIKKEKGI